RLAEQFLSSVMQLQLSNLEFVETRTEQRPKRADHSFTWKHKDFSFRDATHRVQVDVRGNEVGLYKEYLKVPDQWIRDYEKLRSLNNTTSVVDTFAIMLLFLGLLVVIVAKVRHRDVKWKTAGIFGGITFVLVFLSSLNTFPRAEYGYQTTESYGGFLA